MTLIACGVCHNGFMLNYLRYSKNGFLVCRDCYYGRKINIRNTHIILKEDEKI